MTLIVAAQPANVTSSMPADRTATQAVHRRLGHGRDGRSAAVPARSLTPARRWSSPRRLERQASSSARSCGRSQSLGGVAAAAPADEQRRGLRVMHKPGGDRAE